MAAETINTPLRRERKSFARCIRSLWRRIEPGFTFNRAFIERWDGAGEGDAVAISFEGFGLSFSFFVGRTPPLRAHQNTDQAAELARWYNGEGR